MDEKEAFVDRAASAQQDAAVFPEHVAWSKTAAVHLGPASK
jgi:hypothetical protein